MKERIRLFFKYTVLRYRASKALTCEWTEEELELLDFVKCHIRQSSSIETSDDGAMTKIISGSVEFTLHKDRLIVTNTQSYLDVKVGELVKRVLNSYINRVLAYRILVFNKKCQGQVKKLIHGF